MTLSPSRLERLHHVMEERTQRGLAELAERRVVKSLKGPIDDTVAAHRPVTVRDLLPGTRRLRYSLWRVA